MNINIEKNAKLFEAGSYPDKNIEITEGDLDAIINSSKEIPLKIEHIDTALDGAIGVVKNLYRKGKELFGKISFTSAAWSLLEQAEAKKLSVSLTKDKSSLAEVSIVRSPRIADATVFCDDSFILFGGEIETNKQFEELRNQVAAMEVERKIEELKRLGKITKASEKFAKAILTASPSTINFDGNERSLSDVFLDFLSTQGTVIHFGSCAKAKESDETPEIFKRLGVTSEQVKKYR